MSPKKSINQKYLAAGTPEIRAAVVARLKDRSLSCKVARSIADEFEINYRIIGAIADDEGIRIQNCGLGCF